MKDGVLICTNVIDNHTMIRWVLYATQIILSAPLHMFLTLGVVLEHGCKVNQGQLKKDTYSI